MNNQFCHCLSISSFSGKKLVKNVHYFLHFFHLCVVISTTLHAEEPGTGHNPHPYNCTAVLNFELNRPLIPHIFPTNSTQNQGTQPPDRTWCALGSLA
jgi:hypothetical protein